MLPKALLPFFLSFTLSGGLIAFPGTVLDTLLKSFDFTPTLFGVALFVQGSFALLGTRVFSKASLRLPSLHALEGAALLLPAVGIAVVYLCDPVLSLLSLPPVPASARLVGYAALGAGVGGSGILNNAFALRGADTTRALGFLNMAFTAGAVALPAATSALLSQSHLFEPFVFLREHAWRIPMAVLFLAYLTLASFCFRIAQNIRSAYNARAAERTSAGPANTLSSSPIPAREPPFHPRFPLVAACLLLFCYVGAEVGLSVTWVPFLVRDVGIAEASARMASPFFWGGLFMARLVFAVFPPPVRQLPAFLTVFGVGVLGSLGLALYTVSKHGVQPHSLGPLSPIIDFLTPGAPPAWLALAGLSGAFIGASYSFVLAMLTGVYSGLQTSRAAFAAAQWGVAGAVLVPPALGAYIDATSFTGGLSFVFVTMVPFTLAAFVLFYRSRELR